MSDKGNTPTLVDTILAKKNIVKQEGLCNILSRFLENNKPIIF